MHAQREDLGQHDIDSENQVKDTQRLRPPDRRNDELMITPLRARIAKLPRFQAISRESLPDATRPTSCLIRTSMVNPQQALATSMCIGGNGIFRKAFRIETSSTRKREPPSCSKPSSISLTPANGVKRTVTVWLSLSA